MAQLAFSLFVAVSKEWQCIWGLGQLFLYLWLIKQEWQRMEMEPRQLAQLALPILRLFVRQLLLHLQLIFWIQPQIMKSSIYGTLCRRTKFSPQDKM
jgi:hypothetical protein